MTHSHTQAGQLCDQALWLQCGKAVRNGPSKEVVKGYLAFLNDEEAARGDGVDSLAVHDRLLIRYLLDLKARVRDLNVSLSLWRKDGLHITTISTLNGVFLRPYHDGRIRGEVEIPTFNFTPGHYALVMPIHEDHGYLYHDVVKKYAVTGRRTMVWGLVYFHYD